MTDSVPSKQEAYEMQARSLLRQARCPECNSRGYGIARLDACAWCRERDAVCKELLQGLADEPTSPPADDDYWDWLPQGDVDKAPPQFNNQESHAWASGFDAGVKELSEKIKARPAQPPGALQLRCVGAEVFESNRVGMTLEWPAGTQVRIGSEWIVSPALTK